MRIDLGFSLMGSGSGSDQRYIHITRKDVVNRIKKHPTIDSWVKDYLCKRIDDYPDSALIFFVKNIDQIVASAINERSRVMKEQHEIRKKAASEVPEYNEPSFVESPEGIVQAGGEEGIVQAQETPDEERESLFSRRPAR